MKKNLTIGITVLALVTVLAAGATLYGASGTYNSDQNIGPNIQDPSYIGSISVPPNAGSQTLAGLAKITASAADKAALAKFPGATVMKTSLEDENGALVYSVTLQTATGIKDVKVDAGNAQILYTSSGGNFSEGSVAAEGVEAGE